MQSLHTAEDTPSLLWFIRIRRDSVLALALLVSWLVGGIQIIQAISYFPKSIRSGKSYAQLTSLGKVKLAEFVTGLVRPLPIRMVDGLFSPEITASVGLTGLAMAFLTRDVRLWGILILFILLANGGWLFRLTAKAQFRLPARWTYFAGLALTVMAVEGFSKIPATLQPFVLVAQAVNLLLIHPKLWPMEPFVQRWERPSRAFDTERLMAWMNAQPNALFLYGQWCGGKRIPGLPYPWTTGQIHHVKTLGYSGGSQLKAMAWLRNDRNPNGSGDHFGKNMDKDKLAWWLEGHSWQALEEAYERQGH